jgi:hypothetical protein
MRLSYKYLGNDEAPTWLSSYGAPLKIDVELINFYALGFQIFVFLSSITALIFGQNFTPLLTCGNVARSIFS